MSFSGLECYAMDKLQCGSADLSMLDHIYSTLGEDVYDTEDLVSETDDLNELLEKAYDQISEAVKDKLYEIADYEDNIEVTLRHRDNDGDICDTEIYYVLEITEEIAEQLKELADELTENYACANCLDTHFKNDLDQVVDWDYNVEQNTIELIEYWIDKEKLDISVVDVKEIVAHVLAEDGTDYEYERYYELRGKKVYKDDDCICDMSDEDDLDYNFISERICEDISPDFVKSIDLEGEEIFDNPEYLDCEDDE